jgi:hypothetical protein
LVWSFAWAERMIPLMKIHRFLSFGWDFIFVVVSRVVWWVVIKLVWYFFDIVKVWSEFFRWFNKNLLEMIAYVVWVFRLKEGFFGGSFVENLEIRCQNKFWDYIFQGMRFCFVFYSFLYLLFIHFQFSKKDAL